MSSEQPNRRAALDDNPDAQRDDPATTIRVIVRVRPGQEAHFEEFLAEMEQVVSQFPGYLGSRVFRPARRAGRQGRYSVVQRFDRESNQRRWAQSDERREWSQRARAFTSTAPRIANITGTAQDRPLAMALSPLDAFVRTSVSGIGLLLLATLVAILLANSPLSDSYERFWATKLTIGVGRFEITESLRHWVNDGLMALFFFIVGLEIKREVLVGELREPRQAALPIAAAVGGALVPALVFLAVIAGGDGIDGWGIPIGTDTAFSLGIITLLGARVRPQLLVFLTAFAIVDDIIAVLIIAVFYTNQIDWLALGAAAGFVVLLLIANLAGFQRWPVYALLGVATWLAVFSSGVHGTLAGVLVAMTIPARSWINPSEFLQRGRLLLDEFEHAGEGGRTVLSNATRQEAVHHLEQLCEDVEAPMTHFEHQLGGWVAFAVLPLFAFANAGIPLVDRLGESLSSAVLWGVVAGLIVGKPLGVLVFAWLSVRVGLALMPEGVAWRHILGVAFLGGIGFTMSLFITELAFGDSEFADIARVGILFGSAIAGAAGYLLLRATLPQAPALDAATLAGDRAEQPQPQSQPQPASA